MRTEIICVGSELLTGKPNTNSTYIGERLGSIGIDVSLMTTVGDQAERIGAVLRAALGRSRIIIVTGGLGPTFDDVTRESVAAALGRRLAQSADALDGIARYFKQRGIAMPENNERQAGVIDGARLIPNHHGSAPGQFLEIGKKGAVPDNVIILLPGPPKEMQHMFEEAVFSYVKQFESGVKKSFVLHVSGMPESAVDERIRPIVETERKLELGRVDFTILASHGAVDIKASVIGGDELIVDEMLNNLKHELYAVLGDSIYGEGKQTPESVAGELMLKMRKTLSTAESCTGGLVAQRVTNVAGSSMYFKQAAVTYSNESKVSMLGVERQSLERFGAVSEQVALEMARGARRLAASDYALSITGIAGPGGATPEKPAGLVFIALAGPGGEQAFRFQFSGDRATVRECAANQAFDILRRELLKEVKHKTKRSRRS